MKKKIRRDIYEKRKQLSRKEILKKSKNIKYKLFNLTKFAKSETILFYVSYDNEVFTHNIIKEAISSGKKTVVPIVDKERHRLMLSVLESWNDLQPGSYGVLEPKKNCLQKISPKEINLIIVPGVGFDKKGNRLGHGEGYYDRLLSKTYDTLSIGLAFETQIIENIPIDTHDEPVDIIITEKRVIKC
ncbi:MAG: 5-formyltetrahydrofolate cyclo-ligase, partial [Candidatus Thermoplasmatota archaeon]